MLARHMLSLCAGLSVCLLQTGIKTTGRIELVSGIEASFLHFLQGNLGVSTNKGTSLWNFVPNSEVRKFHHGNSIVLPTKLVDDTYDGLHVVAVYCTSVNCNPPTPYLGPSNNNNGDGGCGR